MIHLNPCNPESFPVLHKDFTKRDLSEFNLDNYQGSKKISNEFQITFIHNVKYADDLVLLAKKEKVLQDMIDKLIEIGRCYGMEMNVEKTKVMRI